MAFEHSDFVGEVLKISLAHLLELTMVVKTKGLQVVGVLLQVRATEKVANLLHHVVGGRVPKSHARVQERVRTNQGLGALVNSYQQSPG